MRVTIRCFAQLRELATDRTELDLTEGATLEDAWRRLAERHAGIGPHRPYVRGARNGVYAPWDQQLADGDTVAFLPPVSGG